MGSEGAGDVHGAGGTVEEGYASIIGITDSNLRLGMEEDSEEEMRAKRNESVKQLGHILGIREAEDGSVSVQEDVIFRLVSLTKGKKLLTRSLPFLPPRYRDVLLITTITHLLRFVCSKDISEENERVDDKLSAALSAALGSSDPPVPLTVLSKCVMGMIGVHTIETFPVVLQHKQSSIVIEALLTMGELGASKGEEGVEEWRSAFAMLSDMVVASSHAAV